MNDNDSFWKTRSDLLNNEPSPFALVTRSKSIVFYVKNTGLKSIVAMAFLVVGGRR